MSLKKIINPALIKIPQLSLTVGTSGQVTPQNLQDLLQNIATTTPQFVEGSFVGTYSGFTTVITSTIRYAIIGTLAYVAIGGFSGTSNATTPITISGIPSSLITKNTQGFIPIVVQDNGVLGNGVFEATAGGSWFIGNGFGNSPFTGGAVIKGLPNGAFLTFFLD